MLTEKELMEAVGYHCSLENCRAVERAVMAKLNSAEPVAWLYDNEYGQDKASVLDPKHYGYGGISVKTPLYEHPQAPSVPEDFDMWSKNPYTVALQNSIANDYVSKPPAPSAVEGLLDLLAIIHRDGGHYTDEHGILKSVTDAKDKVWTMLAAAPSAVEWQPIETAPKDGTCVLVATEHGSWVAKHEAVFQSDNPWRSMMLNHDSINREYRTGRPTHWMPLSKPPVAAARSE